MTNTDTVATAAPKHYAEITAFFGGNERTFRLDYKRVVEWEENTGFSLMASLTAMVKAQSGVQSPLRELIRLALIGGGLTPSAANIDLQRNFDPYPPAECFFLALTIAEAALYGSDEYRAARDAKAVLEGAVTDGE